jgi:septal ring-binding cell division protein DamX
MARQESRNEFTLQLAIACQEESVKKAARQTRGSVEFFVVPFPLQGKACYRLCWGAYPTLQLAQEAKSSVPESFRPEGVIPVVVSIKKLSPAEIR